MKSNNYSAKIILSFLLGLLSILGMTSFAANPSFSISPASFTGKLHCEYMFDMILNPGWLSYNAFQSTIRLESWNVLITPISIHPLFNGVTDAFITSWFLYQAWGTMAPWQSSTATISWLTFTFKTLQNITSTNLLFTTITGWAITFNKNTTDDWAVINSSINSLDILTWVNNWSYTFVPLPCIIDSNAPIMSQNTPSDGQRYIPSNYTISFLLYDRIWSWIEAGIPPMTNTNNRQHYRYSGLNTSVLANYVPAPSSVDNQEGVNSWNIQVTVSCPTCLWWVGWTYTTPAIPSVAKTPRTGNGGINELTRQNKVRWYIVSFPSPAPYEVEKQINVSVSVSDNPNENNVIHTWTPSFSFNAPQNPSITRLSPLWSTNIPTTISPVVFALTDDWAGINTWSISITIPAFSSWSKSYSGYTYSWSELTIILTGWALGTGNSWSYEVSFVPKRPFPSNSTLHITWSTYDLAGNLWTYNQTFTTSMSCEDFGCANAFSVNILGGIHNGLFLFTWLLIQITWTNINSPYPYFTGINNDILMCWVPYSWTMLTWNIWIFDTTWAQINGIIYTWSALYITWMDGLTFVLSGGSIIIQ